MTERPIIDAGPGLNFFSINKERLLIATLGQLSAPESVRDEMLGKARRDPRFAATATVLGKLGDKWMRWLSDDITADLAAVVQRISGLPMAERLSQANDLGEIMVVAHAVVLAEAGSDVTVLIDDQRGARIATLEIRRLERLKSQGRSVGAIKLINTVTVLQKAAGTAHIPTKSAMRDIYGRLRGLDDGLMPIDGTPLLTPSTWP